MSRTIHRVSTALPALLVLLTSALTLTLSIRVGALTLAAGVALLALMLHLERATRRPWRSQSADLATLIALALAVALLALSLP